MSGYYLTAQVCLNGHVITDSLEHSKGLSEKFCHVCGAETISECLNCHSPIQGEYYVDGLVVIGSEKASAPAYCHNCGEPFPWTTDALEATRMLIDEEADLNVEERENLKLSLPDLIAETPKTILATTRVKKAFMKGSEFFKDGLKQFVIDFACAVVKSQLGL